jgi:hypothetical protein
MRKELAIQPYISKRRMHVDATKDQEKAYMWFAVMEAIQVIKPMNAPMTTKTVTRPMSGDTSGISASDWPRPP